MILAAALDARIAYTPIDLAERVLPDVAGASLSYLNTDADLQTLVEAVASIARQGQ